MSNRILNFEFVLDSNSAVGTRKSPSSGSHGEPLAWLVPPVAGWRPEAALKAAWRQRKPELVQDT